MLKSFATCLFGLFLVVAVVNSHEECKRCDLACHITVQEHGWTIKEKRNIYGNDSTDASIVKTWNGSALEKGINEQINRELFAQYTYTSMSAHFDRDDIHMPGFAKFFKEAAEEEYKHAMMLMEYQNKRGGRVKLGNMMEPCKDAWGNGMMAMEEALKLEKVIYRALMDLHEIAEIAHDHQMMDFIEGKFLGEQIDSIKLLGNYVNTLGRLGPGLGEYQFDKNTLGGGEK